MFLPKLVDDPETKQRFALFQKRVLLQLQSLTGEVIEDITEELSDIDAELLSFVSPRTFHGSEGVEAKYVRGFEQTCVALTRHSIAPEPHRLTTLRYLLAVESLRALVKPKPKHRKK